VTIVKDLLRRRVPQVVAIYFVASWGLLEFLDFITQRFALSPHLIDLGLFVPLLLLPSVILVTYFHGAAGADKWVTAEKIVIPINLVVAGGFLLFFLQGKDLGATTTTVTVTNEEGVEMERVVPKSEFRKRIAVYFFDSEPGDTAAAWVQYGLPVAVATDLTQDEYIDLRMSVHFAERLRETGFNDMVNVPLALKREIAEGAHRDHFVTGSVSASNGTFQATVSLYETQRGRLVEERSYEGSDVLALADQISVQLRDDLKIPDRGEEAAPDLPVSELLTNSPEAFRLSIESMRAIQIDQDFARGTSLMEAAVAEDPRYADAQADLGTLYLLMNRPAEMAGPMQAAMDHSYRLPERARFVLKSNYYLLVHQDMERAYASLEMWAELFPDDLVAYQALLQIQTMRDDKTGALGSLEKILELDSAQRDVLLQMGDLRQAMGDVPGAKADFQRYAQEFPEDHDVLGRLAQLSLRSGEIDKAREHFNRAMILAPSDVGLLVGMGDVERAAGELEEALARYQAGMSTASTPEERAQVYSALVSLSLAKGQVGKALEFQEALLEEALTYEPIFNVAQFTLIGAGLYAEAGREEDAFAMVAEAGAQLAPPFDGLVPLGDMQIYLALEDADAIEGTLPGVEAFIDALQYEVIRPAVLSARGQVHELRGEYREAIQQYEEEQRMKPADTSIRMKLGRCYRELGELDEAENHLQEALKSSPFGPRTNYEMALTYEAMGRTDEAREHLGRSLAIWSEADPEYRWARRARAAAERIGGFQAP